MSSTQNHLSRRTQVPHIRIESPSSSDQTRRVIAQLEADPFSYSMYQPPLYMSSSTLFSGEGYEFPNHQFSPMDELSNDSFSLGDLGLDMSLLSEITPQHSQEFCEPFLTGPEVFGTSDFQVIPPSPPPETAVNSPFTPVFTPSPTSSYGSPSPSPISHELPQSPWSTSSDGSVSPMVPPSGLSRRESSASLRHRHSPSDPTIFGHTLQPPTAARHIRSHSESSTTRPVASQAMLEANQRRRRHDATHVCNECGQTFTAIFSLKRHMQSHSGIRPFVCGVPGCDQAFFNQSDCKRHEKSRKRHRGLPHPLSVSS